MIFDTVAKLRSHMKTEHQVNGGDPSLVGAIISNVPTRPKGKRRRNTAEYTHIHTKDDASHESLTFYFECSSCFYNCASVDDFEAHVLNSRLSQESPKKRRRSSTSNLFPRPLELVSNHCIL